MSNQGQNTGEAGKGAKPEAPRRFVVPAGPSASKYRERVRAAVAQLVGHANAGASVVTLSFLAEEVVEALHLAVNDLDSVLGRARAKSLEDGRAPIEVPRTLGAVRRKVVAIRGLLGQLAEEAGATYRAVEAVVVEAAIPAPATTEVAPTAPSA